MKYVSKIVSYKQGVYILEQWEHFEYIIVTDEDTNINTKVYYEDRDILENEEIYGVVLKKSGSRKYINFIFVVPSYAMSLYSVLDFKKVHSHGKTAMQFIRERSAALDDSFYEFVIAQQERQIFNGPTRALKASSYTLFVTDSIMSSDHTKDYHTLASYLVYDKKYNKDGNNRGFTHVRYYDDYIDIKLFDSVYTFKILDMKKFNNIITKAVCLSKNGGLK